MNILPSVDTIIMAAIVAVMGYVLTKRHRAVAKREAEIDKERAHRGHLAEVHGKSVMSLLEYLLVQTHKECMEAGEIDRYIMRTMGVFHRYYKELGGNGFVDAQIDQMRRLPYSDIMHHEKAIQPERNK